MNDFWSILRLAITCICPIVLVFSMSEFKCVRKRAALILGLGLSVSIAANTAVYITLGRETMMQFCMGITALPALLLLFTLSGDRFSVLFFDFFTAVNVLYLVSIVGLSVYNGVIWVDIVIRVLLFSLLTFAIIRYFKKPYRFLCVHMKKGWTAVSLIPFLFFLLVMFLGMYPRVRTDNFLAVVFLYGILCVVYSVIYQVFVSTRAQLTQEENSKLLLSQLIMQERQFAMQEEHFEHIRILQHDLKHYIRSLSALLDSGQTEQAIDLVCKFAGYFEEEHMEQYCENPILNSVLAYYIGQAHQNGVTVKIPCLKLPSPLPVDSLELSIVFGNALENALNACAALSKDSHKWIEITCVSSPQFVFEIANSYDGSYIAFDEEGFPLSQNPGHGIGTKSIAAFLDKYSAVYDYEAADGVFRLRVMFPG